MKWSPNELIISGKYWPLKCSLNCILKFGPLLTFDINFKASVMIFIMREEKTFLNLYIK